MIYYVFIIINSLSLLACRGAQMLCRHGGPDPGDYKIITIPFNYNII